MSLLTFMLGGQTAKFDNLMGWMMRNDVKLKTGNLFIGAALMVASVSALAYENDDAKEKCRDPKIQEFNLPEYKAPDNKEVPPESEFSFVVSGWSDPKKIKVSGKNKPIPFVVESSETFHKIKGKLPAEFNGQYVRLNARIPALLGCYSNQGWLLKVAAGAKSAQAAPAPTETAVPPAKASETTPSVAPVNPEAKPSAGQSTDKPATIDQKAAEPTVAPAPKTEVKTETPKTPPVEKPAETSPVTNSSPTPVNVAPPAAAEKPGNEE